MRKKFRPNRPRREPASEKSFFDWKNTEETYQSLEKVDLLSLIRGGEDSYVELKVRLTNFDKITAEIVALANSGGGAIIFGVNDNCKVEGVEDTEQTENELRQICRENITPPIFPYIDKVAFDSGKRVVILEVDDRRGPHYAFDNRYYIREGSTKREATASEVALLFSKLKPSGFESVPIYKAEISDLDESFIWSFVKDVQGELFKKPVHYLTQEVVKDMMLAVDYGDRVVPNVGGLLLFGINRKVEELFPRSRVEICRYSGDATSAPVVEKRIFSGNLASIYEAALGFINRYADLWDSSLPKSVRKAREQIEARGNYHKDTILEALTNALVHRDYCSREVAVKINIFDRRVEFINPCYENIPKKGVSLYGLTSLSNPRLKAIFRSSSYGLKTASGGIPMIRKVAYSFSEREPKIFILRDEFKVEIFAV
ncbi:MAG: putative DNA binding domain-containing protein [Blastocatellia bacterium]|nr:putative DNA binding domain-containing protein [Blastocatellia bacterium]